MHYPNRIQTALVFEDRFEALEAAARDFCRIIELKAGFAFTPADSGIEGELIHLVSAAGGLVARFERVGGPPPLEPFEGALASPVTGLFAPEAREALIAARSHVLLEVAHGAPGDALEEAANATLAAFDERLETLALMARIITDHARPSLVHWTQSDQLLTPEQFEAYALAGLPGPLHIHPHLFGSAHEPDREPLVGIRSFGAVHWLGREVVVRPSTLPWQAACEALLAFVGHAATEGAGMPIPDGDTFGSEDGGECYLVHHRSADPDNGIEPAYEITPLRHDASGFVADEYAATAQIVKVRGAEPSEPPGAFQPDQAEHEQEPEPEAATASLTLPPSGAGRRAQRAMIRPTQSHAGETSVSGRSLRARVFGKPED